MNFSRKKFFLFFFCIKELKSAENSEATKSTGKKTTTKKSDVSRVKEELPDGKDGKKSVHSKSPPSRSPTKQQQLSKQTATTVTGIAAGVGAIAAAGAEPIPATATATGTQSTSGTKQSIATVFDPLEDAYDDLTLRCVLYACYFQILLDRNEHNEALSQMEKALNDLPRTKHRMLIYRLKVLTKSRMGLEVQMDLQKFRDESEKNLAQMYRKVAISSLRHSDTIGSYQRAIETLSVS